MYDIQLEYNFKKPVGSIFCIGRNYNDHIKEMKAEKPKEPVVFLKPRTAYCYAEGEIELPDYSKDVQHELELVFVIKKECFNVTKEEAKDYILGMGLGIDFTLRDLQTKAKENGNPWSVAKGFYRSAPVGLVKSLTKYDMENVEFELKKNGRKKQKSNISEMIFDIYEIIEYLSSKFLLVEGDLIFTGTPAGVSKLKQGDVLTGFINGQEEFELEMI
jgi:2-keto-4-pentenoate hydratase/2-oxohepta-3-ene-1,7-dioic acid hydratase in catechol pathway